MAGQRLMACRAVPNVVFLFHHQGAVLASEICFDAAHPMRRRRHQLQREPRRQRLVADRLTREFFHRQTERIGFGRFPEGFGCVRHLRSL